MKNLMPDSRREKIVAELRSSGMLRATDLAERLGVAPVTIRRDIRQLTEEGVLRRVHGGAELSEGAKPDDSAPVPVSGAGARFGILVPTLEYYWPEVIQGAKMEAERRGAQLVLRGSSYESTSDRMQVTRLLNEGVDGLILAPDVTLESTASLLSWLADAGVPTVLVERQTRLSNSPVPIESVTTDHEVGAMLAVHHLTDLGHRTLGFMASSRSPHRVEITEGWRSAMRGLGLTDDLVFPLDFTPGSTKADDAAIVEAALDTALAAGVSALVVHADREAMTLAQLAQLRGLSLPDDVSVIAYDDEVAELFTPPLTAIRPSRFDVGAGAVQLLADRLQNPHRCEHRLLITPQLNVRTSTGPYGAGGAGTGA